ncbi:hypothetical protein GCM10010390_20380 [Streptomyces mordarskii]|uniref:Uncharacterized protein n=1 Tax=Streptomyces mordarskii TaxID=1226758 RepID=A0ABN1CFC1_9ACTN
MGKLLVCGGAWHLPPAAVAGTWFMDDQAGLDGHPERGMGRGIDTRSGRPVYWLMPRAMPITRPHDPLITMMNRTPVYWAMARITARPDCCRS